MEVEKNLIVEEQNFGELISNSHDYGRKWKKCRHTQVEMYRGYLESHQYLIFERSYHFQSNMLSSNFDGLKVLLT